LYIHERAQIIDFMMFFLLAITRVGTTGQLVVNLVKKFLKHI